MLHVGVVFPTLEVTDPAGVRDVVQAVEDLGYHHLLVWDHVLGVDLGHRPDWDHPYSLQNFHEPFVVLGYAAALTRRIELVTGVLGLGQRQTVLVAKQAAQLDFLSEGRVRLGLGIGYSEPEFLAMGASFHDRGKRSEEQIRVLNALWTQEVVTFHGRWHDIDEMGLRPMPVQRPIPCWLGGWSDAALRRAVAMGDGWMTSFDATGTADSGVLDRLRGMAAAAGRDPSTLGVEGCVDFPAGPVGQRNGSRDVDDGGLSLSAWAQLGATHVSVNTMHDDGLFFPGAQATGSAATVQAHIEALTRFRQLF